MNKETNNGNRDCDCTQIDGMNVKNFSELNVTFRELLPSASGQVRRHTRITSRRFTKSKTALIGDTQTSDLAGMNFSSVISTRSWSGPSVNNLLTDMNTHGVFGFDCADISPTNAVAPEWINNFDSLISNFQQWAMQNQVEPERNKTTNSDSQERLANFTGENSLKNHNHDDAVSNCSCNHAGFTSKDFRVSHDSILAQGVTNV